MHESEDLNMVKKVFYVKSNLYEVQAAENSGVLVSSICLDRPFGSIIIIITLFWSIQPLNMCRQRSTVGTTKKATRYSRFR